ncbi:MAG: LPS export ABC transporter permease LptG [Gammaproteobacteria bacterium]|nr:LPS export ABC transporter permease LptG [Gammaproteobacteria bacterium]MBU1655782.1 LPS export ABC transporter permease LptG [Gammaproteobacteria bacterium]MBU1960196.1 LPS export ABC transporter permease LptG [Gammaproteobacteria bacterium]
MTVLDRYLGRQLLFGTLISLVNLLTLLGVMMLFDELGDVGKGRYTTGYAFLFVMMSLPRYAYELFPITALLGSLAGLGALANNSELTAMRAAGISMGRIVMSMMRTGLIMMAAAFVLGEVIAPPAEEYAQQMRSDLISQQITLRSRYGFWARDGHSFINIRKILPGTTLEDVVIYEFDEQGNLKLATHADFAQYQGDKWQLSGIRQTLFSEGRTEVKILEKSSWSSLLNPDLLKVVVVKPHMLPVWGLYRYIRFMRDNGQDANQYEVAFWGKILSPLVTLAMLFLSAPFLFGSMRTVGIGQRIFVGSLMGVVFFLVNKAISYMAVVYSLNALFAAAFPGLVVMALAFWSMRRVH